jgi:hypothetical protein
VPDCSGRDRLCHQPRRLVGRQNEDPRIGPAATSVRVAASPPTLAR